MWELFQKISHGRICLRTVSLMLTSFVMAIFLCSSLLSSNAYALDATRNGTSLSYDNHTFTAVDDIKSGDSRGLPDGTHVYEFINSQTNKREYLFIASTADPASATTATYVTYDFTPPSTYSNPSPSPPTSVAITVKPVDGVAGTTCSSDVMTGIGWVLCPVSYWLAKSVDAIYSVVASFLQVAPLTNSTDNGIYPLWSVVRSFANVCFVIAFLVVIYSQITSIGITNYGIKSVLPRLIIAAILVNISYWVCAVAIDAANLLGFGIQQLLVSIRESMPSGADVSWSNMTNYVLSGGTATAGFLWFSAATAGSLAAAGFLLVATLASAGLSIMVAFIILAARQAIITVLVILSPLAFVAYVLPSTEKWFTKWRSTLMTLLLMFPIFSLLFGGSQLAGMAIMKNSNGQLSIVLIGMATQVVPLIVTPMLVKLSSGLLGTIANMSNDKKRGLVDRTKGWAQNSADYHKDKALGKDKVKPWRLAHRTARAFDRQGKVMAHNRKAFQQAAENHAMASPKYIKADRHVRSVEREKQRLENHHEASWNNSVLEDPNLLKQELELKQSTVRVELSKGKLEKMHAEITAQGDQSEHILHLRGTDADTRSGMLTIARSIKDETFDTYLVASAKGMADRKVASNKAAALKEVSATGDALRRRASGILRDEGGMESIRAQARREASKFLVDDIQNIEATTDNKKATDVDWLLDQLKEVHGKISFAERVAYSNLLAKAGGPGVGNLKKAISYFDDKLGSDIQTSDDLQDYKDFMKGNAAFMGAGKDLEFWATNNKYKDSAGKTVLRSFDEITKNKETWGNISARNFTTLNIASQFRALNVLFHTNRPAYDDIMSGLHANDDMLLGELKTGIRQKIRDIEASADTWGPIPTTLYDD